MDLSWLVWSVTGGDHEGRLGGTQPDPTQVRAFRFASVTHDPCVRMERLGADDPSVVEMQLARLEYAVMTTAVHHCDIGMEPP
eukprot:8868217-Pyramimonas_sp.AAC.1